MDKILSVEDFIVYRNHLEEILNDVKIQLKKYKYLNISLNVLFVGSLLETSFLYFDGNDKGNIACVTTLLLLLSTFYVKAKKI